jgi:putative membrane protein
MIEPASISRPAPALLRYYMLMAVLALPAFPIVALVSFFKYETLRYRFDDEGVTMSWGILFRREITLAYRRIQDIHVTRNILERWMDLATVSVQTASAASGPQMQIQGIHEYGELRDFLYMKMRGARADTHAAASAGSSTAGGESLALLESIRDEVVRLRHLLEDRTEGRQS